MATTHLELAMAESMRNLLEITQELQAANYKQSEEIKELCKENRNKDQQLEQLHLLLDDQEQELKHVRRDNYALQRQLQTCGRNSRRVEIDARRSPPVHLLSPSTELLRLLRASCTCSFGCFLGVEQDDDTHKAK